MASKHTVDYLDGQTDARRITPRAYLNPLKGPYALHYVDTLLRDLRALEAEGRVKRVESVGHAQAWVWADPKESATPAP